MIDRTPRFLVTAGSTRERIDQVRDWGNIFTGNTGFGIARALAARGDVDLVTSNFTHLRELSGQSTSSFQTRGTAFSSHADLRNMLEAKMTSHRYDAVFMTAAVSDYTPEGAYQIHSRQRGADGSEVWIVRDVQAGKVKSSFDSIAIAGRRTEKLVDLFRGEWGYSGLLVKFKLEVGITHERLIQVGQASRRASGADYLVANTLDMVSGDDAGCYLLSDAGAEWVGRTQLATRMCALVDGYLVS